MPTNRTRRGRTRSELDWAKLGDLHHGPGRCLLAGMGYYMFQHGTRPSIPGASVSSVSGDEGGFYWQLRPDNQAKVVEAMRGDWLLHHETIMEAWTGEGSPWALREFGEPGK